MQTKNEYYVIGDGNCGPRAIIQNLLLEGIAKPEHKQFVCDYLRGLYLRNKANLTPYVNHPRHVSHPRKDNKFGAHDPRPSPNLYNDNLYRLPLGKKNDLEQQLISFLDMYEKLDATEENLNLLIEKLMPKTRGVPPTHDHLIYLLAAYLRFDMNREIDPNSDDPIIQWFYANIVPLLAIGGTLSVNEIIEFNGILERNTHASFIACYLAKYEIGYLLLDRGAQYEVANNQQYFTANQPKLSLVTLTTGLHFSVQWNKPELQHSHNVTSEEKSGSFFNFQILNGFLIALGITAFAVALTALSLNFSLMMVGVGIASLSIGGYGFFKTAKPSLLAEGSVPAPSVLP